MGLAPERCYKLKRFLQGQLTVTSQCERQLSSTCVLIPVVCFLRLMAHGIRSDPYCPVPKRTRIRPQQILQKPSLKQAKRRQTESHCLKAPNEVPVGSRKAVKREAHCQHWPSLGPNQSLPGGTGGWHRLRDYAGSQQFASGGQRGLMPCMSHVLTSSNIAKPKLTGSPSNAS